MAELQALLSAAVAGDDKALAEFLAFIEQDVSIEQQSSIHLYLKAKAQQYPHAIYVRAQLYEKGLGVKQDDSMAFLLMREAAAKGDGLAVYEVGHRFLLGKGVEVNYDSAAAWLERAAGSPYYIRAAMHDLSHIYANGLGREKDDAQAMLWRNRAQQRSD